MGSSYLLVGSNLEKHGLLFFPGQYSRILEIRHRLMDKASFGLKGPKRKENVLWAIAKILQIVMTTALLTVSLWLQL